VINVKATRVGASKPGGGRSQRARSVRTLERCARLGKRFATGWSGWGSNPPRNSFRFCHASVPALRRGERFALLGDLTTSAKLPTVAIKCFGRERCVTFAHVWLHQRTGAPLYPTNSTVGVLAR
jgi:hypothetical protein